MPRALGSPAPVFLPHAPRGREAAQCSPSGGGMYPLRWYPRRRAAALLLLVACRLPVARAPRAAAPADAAHASDDARAAGAPGVALSVRVDDRWVDAVRATARPGDEAGTVVVDAELPAPVTCRPLAAAAARPTPDTLVLRLDARMPAPRPGDPPGTGVDCPAVAGMYVVRAVVRLRGAGRTAVVVRYVVPRNAGPAQIDTAVLAGVVTPR